MNHLMTSEFITLFEKYPLYSQQDVKDPQIIVKLFDAYGAATWFLTEFDPVEKIAFGYVTGLVEDEWGYVSMPELEKIKFSAFNVPRIERDNYFDSCVFSKAVKPN